MTSTQKKGRARSWISQICGQVSNTNFTAGEIGRGQKQREKVENVLYGQLKSISKKLMYHVHVQIRRLHRTFFIPFSSSSYSKWLSTISTGDKKPQTETHFETATKISYHPHSAYYTCLRAWRGITGRLLQCEPVTVMGGAFDTMLILFKWQ